jgi:predicted metallopeptidase
MKGVLIYVMLINRIMDIADKICQALKVHPVYIMEFVPEENKRQKN